MTFTDVKRKVSHDISHDNQWVKAADAAKKELAEAEERVRRLKDAVNFFEGKIASGAPWPGEDVGTAA